jgi:glycosyltransferase involved in cell wall biosynthesis
MKILILSDDFPPFSFGGAGVAAYRLAKGLQIRGHEVSVFSVTQNNNEIGQTSYDDVPVSFYFSDYSHLLGSWVGLYNPKLLKSLDNVLKEFKPDVVHAHNVHHYISYASLRLSKKYGPRVFLTAHDTNIFYTDKFYEYIDKDNLKVQSDFNYAASFLVKLKQLKKTLNPFRFQIIKYYLKSVNNIFAVSHNLASALDQNGVKNVKTIYNGVVIDDREGPLDKQINLRKKFNIADSKKIILVAGRFNTLKGGKMLLLYIAELKKTRNDFVVVFAGQKNNLAKEVMISADRQELGDYLIFTGWINPLAMASVYRACDLVMTPSLYLDVFNLTNIEASVQKKPVVGTCFGGTSEIVVDGVTGYIVNPYNVSMVADRVAALLDDPQKSKQFGQAGYKRVKELFSLDDLVDKTLSYYKK